MKKSLKIIILLVILLIIFIIYTFFKNDKINYIALGDSLAIGMNSYNEIGYSYTDYLAEYLKENNKLSYYTKKYANSGYRAKDLINQIRLNNKIKKDLRESNLVTVSIGGNDLLDNININDINIKNILKQKQAINKVIPNIEKCIKEIRKYAKQDLIIIGYYNPIPFLFNISGKDLDILFAYIDDEYKKIAEKYKSKYISIYQLFKNNSLVLPNPNNIHPNIEGYKKIFEEIIKEYNVIES